MGRGVILMKQVVVTALAAFLTLGAFPLRAEQGQSTIIQKIIVKVNGEILTQTDLVQLQIEELRRRSPQERFNPKDLQNNAKLAAALAEITPALLLEAVDDYLMAQHGRELGLKLSDEQYKRILNDIKTQNKLTDDQLQAALLQDLGMTMAQYRQMIEKQYLRRGVQERELVPRMTLTEEEARKFYATHPELFSTPETIVLREIFVAVPAEAKGGEAVINVAADEAAKAKIQAARDRLLKGEDFAKVAAEVSESASKASGGLLGELLVTDLNPQIAPALSKLKAGDVSEPIRTATGYLLYKVDSRTTAGVKPFEAVRQEIHQRIVDERMLREEEKFVEKLRAIALIEWKDESMKTMYETALKARQASAPK